MAVSYQAVARATVRDMSSHAPVRASNSSTIRSDDPRTSRVRAPRKVCSATPVTSASRTWRRRIWGVTTVA